MGKSMMNQMLLLALVLGGSTAGAYDFKAGDLYYNIVEGGVEVTYSKSDKYTLAEVNVPAVVSDGSNGYNVIALGDSAFLNVESLKAITLPEGLKTIGKYALSETSISGIEFPESLEEVKSNAFYECMSLGPSVVFPDNVTTLGSNVFTACNSLHKVTFGKNMRTIGRNIFGWIKWHLAGTTYSEWRGPSITELVSRSLVPPAVDGYFVHYDFVPFYDVAKSVRVPEATLELYKRATGWKYFGSDIVGDENLPGLADGHVMLRKDKISYELAPETKTASIIRGSRGIPSFDIPTTVINDGEIYTVTEIGHTAFFNFAEMKSITLPKTIRKIGMCAFEGCTALTSLDLSGAPVELNERAFAYCTNLTEIKLDNCKSIGRETFAECNKLAKLTLSNQVTEIPDRAFYRNLSLPSFDFHEGITSIGSQAFASTSITSAMLPNSLTCLGDSVFYRCLSLTSASLPNTIKEIPRCLFNEAWISELKLSSSVTAIGDGAFKKSGLNGTFVIPASVKSIGKEAFSECIYLKTMYFKGRLDSIGEYAFSYCSALETLHIDDLNGWAQTEFKNSSANPISKTRHFYVNNKSVPQLNIDLGDGTLSPYAFNNCNMFLTVRVKAHKIGERAFANCANISSAYMEAEEVESNVFTHYPFDVYVNCAIPPVAKANTFADLQYSAGYLYVPKGSRQAYKASTPCWGKFLDIVEKDFTGLDEIFGESGIDDVEAVIPEGEAEYYDLRGVRVNPEGLAPGLYIKRQGGKSSKVIVN